MRSSTRKAVAVTAAALALVLGTSAGYAAASKAGKPGSRTSGTAAKGQRGGCAGPRAGAPALFAAAASYIGVTQQELRVALRDGQSLAELATSKGKSVDGLKQAIVAAEEARLTRLVSAGTITAAQKQAMLERLRSHIDDLVEREGPPPGGPRGGGPPPWAPAAFAPGSA